MSLRPRQLEASLGLYQAVMFGESGLSRAERELIATVVSRVNECFY
jgi:alkylhydroperoxidase family enzyme